MTNYYNILKNVCVLAHEEKPTAFSTSESPYTEIKQYINDILEEVCSKFYWTYRERSHSLSTISGQKDYALPSGMETSGIIENGVRIEGVSKPLYFIYHSELDSVSQTNGKPYRYSIYSDKLILDPVPDDVYSVVIKYLTANFAYNSDKTVEKPKLDLETDITILPDRFVKVIEWELTVFIGKILNLTTSIDLQGINILSFFSICKNTIIILEIQLLLLQ